MICWKQPQWAKMANNDTLWGVFLYKRRNKEQLKIEDFFLPFGGKLDSRNRLGLC